MFNEGDVVVGCAVVHCLPNNIVTVVDDDDDGKDPCVLREDFEAPNRALCNTIPSQATSFDWQVVRMLAVWYYSLGGPGGGLQAGYAWLSHPPCCLGRSHTHRQHPPTHHTTGPHGARKAA